MDLFIKNLKLKMDELNITQADLVSMTGLPKSSISQYLSGKNIPRKRAASIIAHALDVPLDWLTGDIEGFDPEADGTPVHPNNLKVAEAAKYMGVGKQFIRVGLQVGALPFGYAVLMPSGKYRYYISPKKFTEHTGIECDEQSFQTPPSGG